MKLITLMLFIVLFLSARILCDNSDELIIDCEYYSHFDGVDKASGSKPLQFYKDSAFIFSEIYDKYLLSQQAIYADFEQNLLFKIDTVANISDHAIVDIIFEQSPGGYLNEIGKMVLIETDPGLFKLLHAALTSPGVYVPEKTVVKNYGSYEIIYTKSRYHGQFTWYTEDYWIYNIEGNCFRRLNYYSTIKDTVNSLMPDSCSLSRSIFVTDSLFWSNYLKTEDDHYHWPTCGRIKVWFKLQNCTLLPERIEYDPDDKSPH